MASTDVFSRDRLDWPRGRIRLGRFAAGFVVAGFIVALSSTAPWAQDAADFVVRLNRIEGQMRQLSGQVEQLQFENRQLKDQLRKFQEDVEFRFQERGGRSASPPAAPQPPSGTNPSRPGRRSDAFDPDANPGAPGAPKALGSTAPLPPPAIAESEGPSGPPRSAAAGRDDVGGVIEDDDVPASARPLDLGAAARLGPPVEPPGQPSAPASRPSIAATGSDDPRQDYDTAYAYLMQHRYEQSEMAFRRFIQSHPRDRLVADATFWLGESYLQRNRPREAAEQFLKISTEFTRSSKAPDALLKLGVSLAALGARDQACATFAELERKYPGAPGYVRQGVDREQRRARCPA